MHMPPPPPPDPRLQYGAFPPDIFQGDTCIIPSLTVKNSSAQQGALTFSHTQLRFSSQTPHWWGLILTPHLRFRAQRGEATGP